MRSSRSSWIAIFAAVTLVHVGLIAWLIFYLNPVWNFTPNDAGVIYPSITSGVIASGQVQVPEMTAAPDPEAKPSRQVQDEQPPVYRQESTPPSVWSDAQSASTESQAEAELKTDKSEISQGEQRLDNSVPEPESDTSSVQTSDTSSDTTSETPAQPENQPQPQPQPEIQPQPHTQHEPRTPEQPQTQAEPRSPEQPQTQAEPRTPEQPQSPIASGLSQAPAPGAEFSSNFDKPILVHQLDYLDGPPSPAYPTRAKQAGQEGKVVLRVTVNQTGELESIDVRQSSGVSALDEAAQQAVRRVRFRPYTVDGVATRAMADIPFDFVLKP